MTDPTLEQIATNPAIGRDWPIEVLMYVLARELLALRDEQREHMEMLQADNRRLDALERKPGTRNLATLEAQVCRVSSTADAAEDVCHNDEAAPQVDAKPVAQREGIITTPADWQRMRNRARIERDAEKARADAALDVVSRRTRRILALIDDRRAATERAEQAERDLKRFMEYPWIHNIDCDIRDPTIDGTCTCGLLDALAIGAPDAH
ncbi:MAG: hypothetical protein H0X39_00110 [Actinobacteria bacterium]|nr:hypothetical protein [Actinomycetota bacterium]